MSMALVLAFAAAAAAGLGPSATAPPGGGGSGSEELPVGAGAADKEGFLVLERISSRSSDMSSSVSDMWRGKRPNRQWNEGSGVLKCVGEKTSAKRIGNTFGLRCEDL